MEAKQTWNTGGVILTKIPNAESKTYLHHKVHSNRPQYQASAVVLWHRAGFRTGLAGLLPRDLHNQVASKYLFLFYVIKCRVGLHTFTAEGCPGASTCLNPTWCSIFCCSHSVKNKEGRKEMFYLTTHSTHFIYGYMASDVW